MQAHAGPVMDYIFILFPFTVRGADRQTRRQTHKVTDATDHPTLPTPRLPPAWIILAICRPSGCTVVSGVVVVGVCNRTQMRTSKCTCLIFGVSIGLDPG